MHPCHNIAVYPCAPTINMLLSTAVGLLCTLPAVTSAGADDRKGHSWQHRSHTALQPHTTLTVAYARVPM